MQNFPCFPMIFNGNFDEIEIFFGEGTIMRSFWNLKKFFGEGMIRKGAQKDRIRYEIFI